MDLKDPVSVSFPIQWGVQDMFGHVNNVHFLKWFESGRVSYLMQCGARLTSEGVGPILAAIQCDYIKQIKYPDTITVGTSLRIAASRAAIGCVNSVSIARFIARAPNSGL